ncbi:cytochrome c peroxidase [Terasakiella sp. A23]|uniref:cytochrome-c peroxidase n=1 Tax=Terasakiella sp. FCG-A23 TaxID=3080561 RepID=UPI002954592B|nr:cytochrome c peroxidase [Terasakiella sp. A23]MDV7339828.1 cytochrome c peroxidase [Terasakiella sp. A23]
MELSVLLITGIVLGVGVIVLVSGELSITNGLSKASRYILAGFLSFGVMGLTVKAVAILLLQSNPVLARAVDASSIGVYEKSTEGQGRGLIYPVRSKHWKALPMEGDQPDLKLVNLGKRLFFDQRLSSTKTVSCASCHIIGLGGDDNAAVSSGINGKKGTRNAPTVLNAAFLNRLFWDGRARSLEDQAIGPFLNPIEMAMPSEEAVVEAVSKDPIYASLYEKSLGLPITIDGLLSAIAAFEKTLVVQDSPYDRFVRGDETAMTPQQLKGMVLFDEIGCRNCHMDPYFSVAGIEKKSPFRSFPVFKGSDYISKYDLDADKGLRDQGVWRVPSLRNIAETAPYFHNGSVTSLEDAVKVMASAQLGLTISDQARDDLTILYDLDGRVTVKKGRSLNTEEISALVAFLKSLSGTLPMVENPWR